ncbi:uracil phosphoribosyltransferase [Rhizopus microsporus ATCC 52813]|uniref:uracil phosphoribosyltransferase n=1 Tax=Rhizopus microsporus ATCC 52813 TaxID=1340429 RepID=A0A2G4T8R8_RHIZD|nr:uracil phosphoribosyltransferase [Rhizopus microsporus ATCC 52813]PHZ17401.1 uracil phosphoribosyltransferase [Rhizopus microsporus ATCC 52813]
MMTNQGVYASQHPLVAIKLSQLRDKNQPPKVVRELIHDLSCLLAYEATADLSIERSEILSSSPFGTYQPVYVKDKVGLVPVLRSGLGLLNGFLNVFPDAPVYHLGIYREKVSRQPVEYYNKLPHEPNVNQCFVLDPIIATGNTAVATINILKEWGLSGSQIKFVGIIGSKEGVEHLQREHPDVRLHLATIDDVLDTQGYINPGIGDSGDRLWNTIS